MRKITYYLLILGIFAGCQSGPDKATMQASITTLQNEIGGAQQPQPEKLVELQTALEQYAGAFPADSLSVRYLSKAGETARSLQQFDKALEIWDKIEKNYPDSKEAASAMFMKAFTLDNDLRRLDEAKVAYEAFLKKYPNDDFADDAQFLLSNMGKPLEEIVKDFEKKKQQ